MSRISIALMFCFMLISSVFVPLSPGLNIKVLNIEQPTVFSHRGNTLYVGGSGLGNYTKSDFNNIINNIFTSNDGGIRISSNNNVISENTITNNKEGICLSELNNIISGNTISNNKIGISPSSNSDNNKIYYNNFLDNEENAYGDGYNNWDDGTYGNFWSDYKQRYPNAKAKLFKP